MLEMTTLAEHDGDIYCRQCYTRKYGIRGVGFGIGAGALGMDAGERFGNVQSQLYVLANLIQVIGMEGFLRLEIDRIILHCPISHRAIRRHTF